MKNPERINQALRERVAAGNHERLSGDISSGLSGDISSGLRGDISGLSGDISGGLRGDISGLSGDISGGLRGDISGLSGDISGLSGYISGGLRGDISGLSGDILAGKYPGVSFVIASPEEIARLDAVREIVLKRPERLRMDTWHTGNWDYTHTPEEEHTCGSAHCIAGWLQALCPDEAMRAIHAQEAGEKLAPASSYIFFASSEYALDWLKARRYDRTTRAPAVATTEAQASKGDSDGAVS